MNLKGIGLLQLQLVTLISHGKKETLTAIEKHFKDGDIVEYLYSKYKDLFFVSFDNTCYDNIALNRYFSSYVGYIEDNESRKCGIINADDGLLLMIALIADKVEEASYKWTIE